MPTRNQPLKRSQLKRNWFDAIAKRDEEGQCRVCEREPGEVFKDGVGFYTISLEAAHTISRARQDVLTVGPRGGETLYVKPESIVPLCTDCHLEYHAMVLDLLPYLTLEEQLDAVRAAGGLALAYERLTGGRR